MRKMTFSKIIPPPPKKYLWNNHPYVRFGKLVTFSTDFLAFARWFSLLFAFAFASVSQNLSVKTNSTL